MALPENKEHVLMKLGLKRRKVGLSQTTKKELKKQWNK